MSTFYDRNGYTIRELLNALGGGKTGARRDLASLVSDCQAAAATGRPITVQQIAYRLDLSTAATQRVLENIHVAHDGAYVSPDALLGRFAQMTAGPPEGEPAP